LEIIKQIIESNHIRPIIDQRFPLDKATEAFEYQMSGRVKGKLVIQIFEPTSR